MGGWKTWVGGIGIIASGVGLITATIVAEKFELAELAAGMALISKGVGIIAAGFAAIGLGHKLEKGPNGK